MHRILSSKYLYIISAILVILSLLTVVNILSSNKLMNSAIDLASKNAFDNVINSKIKTANTLIKEFRNCDSECDFDFTNTDISGIDYYLNEDKAPKHSLKNRKTINAIFDSGPKEGFFSIKSSGINDYLILYYPTSMIQKLGGQSIYINKQLLSGPGASDLVLVDNTNIELATTNNNSVVKSIIATLPLVLILIVGTAMFFYNRRTDNRNKLIITEQTDALTDANKQLEEERDMFSDGPVIIIKWNSDWKWPVVYSSPNTSKIIEYSYSELQEIGFEEIIHQDDIQRIKDDIDDAIKNHKIIINHREFRLTTKSGDPLWVDANTKIIIHGDDFQMLTYMVNVNDKMDAFMGLRNQRLAMDQATTLSSTDLEGRITYVNDRFCDLCGYSREELIGSDYSIMKSEEHDSQFYISLWNDVLSGRTWSGDICNINKKGQRFWVHVTIIPSLTEAGNVFEFQSIAFEITSTKHAESQAIEAVDMAHKANEAKSHFLANMSHELRTPMNGLMGMATLLKNTELTTQQDKFVSGILSSADHQLSILNDILDLSKMQSGYVDLELIEFDIVDLINNVITLFTPSANDKGIELGLIIGSNVNFNYIGDKARLKQIISNLVNNAIKFTHWGRIIIRVSQSAIHAGIRIEVEDTGVGIAIDAQNKLFKKFSQVDETITRRFGGTGLGLSICKYIIEAMDGEIGVDSHIGSGSTFFVDFPLQLGEERFVDPIPEGVKVIISGHIPQSMDIYREIFNSCNVQYSIISDLNEVYQNESLGHFDVLFIVIDKDRNEVESTIKKIDNSREINNKILVSIHIETDPIEFIENDIRVVVRPATTTNVVSGILESINNIPIELSDVAATFISTPEEPPQLSLLSVADRNFLIVDDDKRNREVLGLFIDSMGGASDHAQDGHEALTLVDKNDYDIIFMDCHMPIMDGNQTIKKIRGMGIHTPIIMVTADISKETRDKAIDSGANDFITKPINLESLKLLISTHISTINNISTQPTEADEIPQISQVDGYLNTSSLDMLLDLNKDQALEIVSDILTSYDDFHDSTLSLLKASNYPELERVIHKFKGGGLAFGSTSIINEFGTLNVYLQENSKFDDKYLKKTTNDLIKMADCYILELHEYTKPLI